MSTLTERRSQAFASLAARIAELEAEVERLRVALQAIIEECPNPNRPYGQNVVKIATLALEAKP